MTHDALIEHGAEWLRNRGCSVVITDMTHSGSETPDCIGWKERRSILIEVKVSRADFLKDKKKPFRMSPDQGIGNLRYFLTPEGLVDRSELPAGWGLLEYREPKGRQRKARIVPVVGGESWPSEAMLHHSNMNAERSLLISAIRRIGQTCPEGVSVKAYTFKTQNRATLGVALPVDDSDGSPHKPKD